MTHGGSNDAMDALALERLTRAMGPIDGPTTRRVVLSELGFDAIQSPSQLLLFAERLIHRGGVFEAVGRGLKVTALLRGATTA